MFKKILYPTDFSQYSNAIADSFLPLRPAGIEQVIILHVIDQRVFAQFPEISNDVLDSMRENAQKNLEALKNRLSQSGLKVGTRLEMGVPFHQIIDIAKTEKVSLIIMGSHGRSLVEEMLLGSTTENVLRHTTVPLLIEKFETKKDGETIVCSRKHQNPFDKVLFPTDFSDCSGRVMPYLKHLKGAGTKEVVVAHVQDMTRIAPHLLDRLPEFEDIDRARLADIKEELIDSGIPNVKVVIKEGVPFNEIQALADSEDVGMIAMGSHGRSMVGEMLLGSTSSHIVRRSKRPILIIRRK